MAVVTLILNTDAMVGMITLVIGIITIPGIPINAGKTMEELLLVAQILEEATMV